MAKSPPEDAPPAGAPGWIVTFTDMMSLLLTFFILLLTFSSTETQKLKELAGALSSSLGAIAPIDAPTRRDAAGNVSDSARANAVDGDVAPSLRPDQAKEAIRGIQAQKRYRTKISVADTLDGFRLTIEPESGGDVFDIVDVSLKDEAREIVAEIGEFFKSMNCRFVIRPHTDNLTWSATGHRSAYDFTRAVGVVTATILESAGVVPELVALSPAGDSRPLVANDTASNRRRNRRIDIMILDNSADDLFAESFRR